MSDADGQADQPGPQRPRPARVRRDAPLAPSHRPESLLGATSHRRAGRVKGRFSSRPLPSPTQLPAAHNQPRAPADALTNAGPGSDQGIWNEGTRTVRARHRTILRHTEPTPAPPVIKPTRTAAALHAGRERRAASSTRASRARRPPIRSTIVPIASGTNQRSGPRPSSRSRVAVESQSSRSA
jgi:hypothetical protein